MADGGASELIMLITGLLTAGIVTSLLIASWGGLATSVDTAKTEAEANSKTQAALASDSMQISWNQTACGLVSNGSAATVSQVQLLDNSTVWVKGEVAELNACPTGMTLTSGQEITITVIVQSEEYKGISGQYSFYEVIRIV